MIFAGTIPPPCLRSFSWEARNPLCSRRRLCSPAPWEFVTANGADTYSQQPYQFCPNAATVLSHRRPRPLRGIERESTLGTSGGGILARSQAALFVKLIKDYMALRPLALTTAARQARAIPIELADGVRQSTAIKKMLPRSCLDGRNAVTHMKRAEELLSKGKHPRELEESRKQIQKFKIR